MEKIYYVGFNAGNAVGNEEFFEGSITVYPTGEVGNIFYSDKFLGDMNSEVSLSEYKEFLCSKIQSIQEQHPESKFMYFNPKIKKMLSDKPDIVLIDGNNSELIDLLNNKFKVRELLSSCVPVLNYMFVKGEELNYDRIRKDLACEKFVVQAQNGSGGDTTYFIDSAEKLLRVSKTNKVYCVSRYEDHVPLNATLIVGEGSTLLLGISAQLISKVNGNFKYVGGDFIYSKTLSYNARGELCSFSLKIANQVKEWGYRGILGIDYIMCSDGSIKFIEINPRLQSSSFLISYFLRDKYKFNIVQLHYMALMGKSLPVLPVLDINKAFLNCSERNSFNEFTSFKIISNGYFKPNPASIYRKIFDYSVLEKGPFEKLQSCTTKNKDLNFKFPFRLTSKSTKLKVCLISEEYPDETNFGGIATYQKRLALALTARGHHVTVISRALEKEQEYIENGVNVIRIIKRNTGNLVEDYTDYRMRVSDILKDLTKKNMIDIIEVPDWGAEAIFYAREKTIPMVVKMHTPLCVWSKFNKNGLGEGIQEKMLKWEMESVHLADKLISCTQILRDMVYSAMKLDKNVEIEVVPNPANIKDFYLTGVKHKSKNILYCGSLEQRKGVDILAHSIAKVLENLNDDEIKFVFVGKDTNRNEKNISMIQYIKQIVPKEYHKHLVFMGQLANSELNLVYNNARLGVIPSRFDNLPYVAMEQMLAQMPIIASANTGVREMITDGTSGLLYNPTDPDELAQKIIYLYNNGDLAKKMGETARAEAINKYSPDVIAKHMEEIYVAEINKYRHKHRDIKPEMRNNNLENII